MKKKTTPQGETQESEQARRDREERERQQRERQAKKPQDGNSKPEKSGDQTGASHATQVW